MVKRADRRKYHYVYKITRKSDGMYYIGIHSADTLDDTYFGSGKRIKRSIAKYGKDAHTKEILDLLPSREAIKQRERELVNEECLNDPLCMNLALGGEGGYVINVSAETREKMRLAKVGKKLSPEHRAKIAAAGVGRTATDETRQKLSVALRGKKLSEEMKSRISDSVKSTMTEERRAEISRRHKGKVESEETKEKKRLAATGKKHTEETKKKITGRPKGSKNGTEQVTA